jgi:hypothetical protein
LTVLDVLNLAILLWGGGGLHISKAYTLRRPYGVHTGHSVDRDSSVGVETRYRLDGADIESRWGARFTMGKVKVKFTLEQATKARRWCRGIAPLFL